MNNKRLNDLVGEETAKWLTLKKIGEVMGKVVEEELSFETQMMFKGMQMTVFEMSKEHGEVFEDYYSEELKVINYNENEFLKKMQGHLNS